MGSADWRKPTDAAHIEHRADHHARSHEGNKELPPSVDLPDGWIQMNSLDWRCPPDARQAVRLAEYHAGLYVHQAQSSSAASQVDRLTEHAGLHDHQVQPPSTVSPDGRSRLNKSDATHKKQVRAPDGGETEVGLEEHDARQDGIEDHRARTESPDRWNQLYYNHDRNSSQHYSYPEDGPAEGPAEMNEYHQSSTVPSCGRYRRASTETGTSRQAGSTDTKMTDETADQHTGVQQRDEVHQASSTDLFDWRIRRTLDAENGQHESLPAVRKPVDQSKQRTGPQKGNVASTPEEESPLSPCSPSPSSTFSKDPESGYNNMEADTETYDARSIPSRRQRRHT